MSSEKRPMRTSAENRLRIVVERDVLLHRWRDDAVDPLGDADLDTLAVVKLAAQRRRDLIIGLPSGSLRLPLLASVLLELSEARRVAPPGCGPVALASVGNMR